MKKLMIAIFFLVICGGAIFFVGWVQFFVPAGHTGVLLSKTGGYNPEPIEAGKFRWQWERLLPTNSTILIFNPEPIDTSFTVQGILPSGELYSRFFEGSPDFSWEISFSLTGHINQKRLPFIVEREGIKDQDALFSRIKNAMERIGSDIALDSITTLLSDNEQYNQWKQEPSVLSGHIEKRLIESATEEIILTRALVTSIRIPDFSMYETASSTWTTYQTHKSTILAKLAAEEAVTSISNYLQIERLSQWGELLTKYPVLIDFLTIANKDIANAIKASELSR